MASSLGSAIAGAGGIIGGIAKYKEGRKMQKKAQAMLDNFEWEELQNPYDNLQVSTLGADLQREEMARTTSTSINALQQGGSRSLIGGLGRVQMQNNMVNRKIAADLDQQQKNIDRMAAADDVRIRQMTEQRQANEVAGYSNMLNVGMNMKHDGFGNMVNGAAALGQGVAGMATGGIGGVMGTATPPINNTPTQWNNPQIQNNWNDPMSAYQTQYNKNIYNS